MPADELLRGAAEARHPAAQQRRPAVHRADRSRRAGAGTNDGLRRRRDVRLLRQPRPQHVLGADAHRRAVGQRQELPGQLDYKGDRYGVQLEHLVVGDNFNPGGRLRAARRHPPQLRPVAIQPAAEIASRRSADSRGWARWPTSRTARGRLETREGDGEFAIEFQNTDRFSVAYAAPTNSCRVPFRDRDGHHAAGRQLRLRQRARRSSNLGPARRSAATSRSSTERSTAATRRRSASAGAA